MTPNADEHTDSPHKASQSPPGWLLLNLAWGLAYMAAAVAGHEIALPPSSVSPIWPAAGVALAALLVHNLRPLPGLIIGCYLVQFITFADTSTTDSVIRSLLIALSATTGSILQAVLANHLLRTHLNWPLKLSNGPEVARFLVYSAFLACTVAPTIGVSSLYLSGAIEQLHILNVWLTWWIGDALGTMIATPLLLAFIGQPARYWRSRRLPLGLPLLLTMLLVGVFFLFSVQQTNHGIERDFRSATFTALTEAGWLIADQPHTPESMQIPVERMRTIVENRLPDDAGFDFKLQNPDGGTHILHQRKLAPTSHDVTFGFSPRAYAQTSMHGVTLSLEAVASKRFVAASYGWELWAMLVAGFAFSAALGAVFLVFTGHKEYADEQVARRSRDLEREAEEHQRTAKVLELQNRILEMIARDEPRDAILDAVCSAFEGLSPGSAFASVMLVEPGKEHLRVVAAPSMPQAAFDALLKFPIGENKASCGTAVFRGEPVYTCDITSDRAWQDFRDFAREYDLHACWSTPLVAASGEVLGSFALTHTEPRSPSARDLAQLRTGASLCALAVEEAGRTDHMNKLTLAVEQNPGAIVITDTRGSIEYVNHRFSDLTGFDATEVVGLRLTEVMGDGCDQQDLNTRWSHLLQGGEWRGKARYQRRDNTAFWAQCFAAAVRNRDGKATHIVATYEDVTELHEASEKISHQARYDQLTGLLNRHEFECRLATLRDQAVDNDEVHTLCFVDMDRFKAVNDSCGHAGGDELLRQVSKLMTKRIRKHDSLARVGGDEFAILFEYCDEREAQRHVEALRQAVREYRFVWGDESFHIGMSAGLVEINSDSPSAQELLKEADSACYQAKREGRNQVRIYHEKGGQAQQSSSELQLVNILREALDQESLQLYQQRIRSLGPGVPDNVEILLRVPNPSGGLHSPAAFLPAAERFGLARNIDAWVVEHTFRHLAEHPGFLTSLGYCAINLSGLSLSNEFAHQVDELLQRYQLPGEAICFEVTETAAIANLSQAQEFIQHLQKHKVRFALDDFGSGLSSYGYLKSLPFDILKIDGQFVRDMRASAADRAIVSSIAELGQALGRLTVAEFVEDQALVDTLRDMGVNFAQGYAIGRPEPLRE